MTKSKVLLFLLLSLSFAITASAADEIKPIDVCRDFSIIAKDVMIARQKDRPMSQTLPVAIDRLKEWADEFGFEMDLAKAEALAADIVMDAYDRGNYPNDSVFDDSRRDEISEFENLNFEECYKGLTSD